MENPNALNALRRIIIEVARLDGRTVRAGYSDTGELWDMLRFCQDQARIALAAAKRDRRAKC